MRQMPHHTYTENRKQRDFSLRLFLARKPACSGRFQSQKCETTPAYYGVSSPAKHDAAPPGTAALGFAFFVCCVFMATPADATLCVKPQDAAAQRGGAMTCVSLGQPTEPEATEGTLRVPPKAACPATPRTMLCGARAGQRAERVRAERSGARTRRAGQASLSMDAQAFLLRANRRYLRYASIACKRHDSGEATRWHDDCGDAGEIGTTSRPPSLPRRGRRGMTRPSKPGTQQRGTGRRQREKVRHGAEHRSLSSPGFKPRPRRETQLNPPPLWGGASTPPERVHIVIQNLSKRLASGGVLSRSTPDHGNLGNSSTTFDLPYSSILSQSSNKPRTLSVDFPLFCTCSHLPFP